VTFRDLHDRELPFLLPVAAAAGHPDGDDLPSATPYAEMQARLVDYARR
jgi:hypothetical protein